MSTFPTPRTCLPDRLHFSDIFTCTWIRLEMKVPLETCSFQTKPEVFQTHAKIMAVVTFSMAKDTAGPWTIEKGDSIGNWQQQQTWATKHEEMFQTQRCSRMTHLKDCKHILSFATGLSLSSELQQHETASDDSWSKQSHGVFSWPAIPIWPKTYYYKDPGSQRLLPNDPFSDNAQMTKTSLTVFNSF